ncbi:MAG: 5-formyltetrahydrofolate cyclo-ligase [Candidatus Pacebacteria bacterium]|nr:5-formyltetrahydrofolate cyclo-ligase [Candidatus Paceibacterota bacterium]
MNDGEATRPNLQKQLLRQQVKTCRQKLTRQEVAQKSDQLTSRLLALDLLNQAKTVCCYLSKDKEPATHQLIQTLIDQNKLVTVPKMIGPGLIKPALLTDFSQLVVSKFQVLEPAQPEFYSGPIELNIMPALAIDRQGNRLGWGGGFYDRWLKTNQPQFNLALIFDCQLVTQVPHTQLDQPVNACLTETEYLIF